MSNLKRTPVKIIIGSDWWDDCDDAVAMRVLARNHKKGIVEILGIGINACMEYSAASLDAFMLKDGVDVPIGIDREATDFGSNPPYQKRLASLPNKYGTNDSCQDAVKLYRQLLHQTSDKVDIIEIGYPQVLAGVHASSPDEISPLTGDQLIREKVNKLWMMAGKWDDLENGTENNFARNPRSRKAANYICINWPTPITFLGWEIANEILTGGELDKDDILYQVLCDHGSPNGRSSWDPMLVLMACINDEKEAGYNTTCGTAYVHSDTGVNNFKIEENGKHKFVTKVYEDDYYKKAINDIILSTA